jgi:hypothetical protein
MHCSTHGSMVVGEAHRFGEDFERQTIGELDKSTVKIKKLTGNLNLKAAGVSDALNQPFDSNAREQKVRPNSRH